MNKAVNNLRLFFCFFSGEDDFIIRKCSKSVQISFAAIGFFVILIFVGCFLSAFKFSSSLFEQNTFVSIPIGLIWALMVVNLYLLLLYTVAPPLLPLKDEKAVKSSFFSFSMLCRIIFMILLALIITQPLNVMMFQNSVSQSLKKHVLEEKTNMIIAFDSIIINQEVKAVQELNKKILLKGESSEIPKVLKSIVILEDKINNDKSFILSSGKLLDSLKSIKRKAWLKEGDLKKKDSILVALNSLIEASINSDHIFLSQIENSSINSESFNIPFKECKESLKVVVQKKIDNQKQLEELLSKTTFYTKKIQLILSETRIAWVSNSIICIIFLLPIYFKYRVRDLSDFYRIKKEVEHRIVVDEYNNFKLLYSTILSNKIFDLNRESKTEINLYLSRLNTINPQTAKRHLSEIEKELENTFKEKYEYWEDSPFRTKKRKTHSLDNQEADLLGFIYENNLIE